MTKPNFFIIGAPKCGTTALAQALGEHPDIYMSDPKEPLYFLHPDADDIRKFNREEHYLSIFDAAGSAPVVGEASVWYLYSDHAREAIRAFAPEAKILVMRRDPATFVASLHAQLRFGGLEPIADLALAWREMCSRLVPRDLASLESLPQWRRHYGELLQFDKYIARWRDTFGAEQILEIDHADLAAHPRDTYLQVLAFLNLPDDGRATVERVNEGKAHRSELVRRILRVPGRVPILYSIVRRVKAVLGIRSFGLYRTLRRANITAAERDPMPTDLSSEIRHFAARVMRD